MPTTPAHRAAASQELMEENGLEKAIHPSYSSDFAPSDFYLFSHVKHCLRAQSVETANQLFLAIDVILRDIEQYLACGFSRLDAETPATHCSQW
jgi:hypothetical protein